MPIPDYAIPILREFVNKEQDEALWRYARQLICSWDIDGFKGEWEARIVYGDFITACQIRHYCRKHKIPTCKGSHLYTCQNRDPRLYRHVGCDGQWENLSWRIREVDELRNLYIEFN